MILCREADEARRGLEEVELELHLLRRRRAEAESEVAGLLKQAQAQTQEHDAAARRAGAKLHGVHQTFAVCYDYMDCHDVLSLITLLLALKRNLFLQSTRI